MAAADHPCPLIGDLEQDVESLQGWLVERLNDLAPPMALRETAKRVSAPWFTEALRAARSQCKVAERAWRLNYDQGARLAYKTMVKSYHRDILWGKRDYLARRIDAASNSCKEIFSVVREFMTPRSNISQGVPSELWLLRGEPDSKDPGQQQQRGRSRAGTAAPDTRCRPGRTTWTPAQSAGIGSGKAPLDQCIELAQRPGVRQHWISCQHLIIDEVSMVEGEFFDKLEAVARAVRRKDEPFGGIQLIICGDFLQLPPVTKTSERTTFCFQAKSWQKCIHLNMELTAVRRQTDKTFISLLQAVRLGRCTEEVTDQLTRTVTHRIERDGILATRLCTHKDDVEVTNESRLAQLPGEMRSFEALDSDPMLVKTINAQCPVGRLIQLKEGAQVMLAKNLDVGRGLVNGARGVVVGFQAESKGLPKVRFLCGVTEVIKMERWVFKAHGGIFLTRQQLPLKLAWAISIHKSQGMSLDCVEISLARVFESGQAYVALSRARSLEGLRVMDFDPKAVRANPHVLQFYSRLRKERALTQTSIQQYMEGGDKENNRPNW
ncbi:ATP-dependent DNA helicase PIF1-like [Lissotriton helveticus]